LCVWYNLVINILSIYLINFMNKNEFPLPVEKVSNVNEKGEIPKGRDEERVYTEKDLERAKLAEKVLLSEKGKRDARNRIAEIKEFLAKINNKK